MTTPTPDPHDPGTAATPGRLVVRIDPDAVARITAAMAALTATMNRFVEQIQETEKALNAILEKNLLGGATNDPTIRPPISSVHPGFGVTSDPPHDPLNWVTAWGHTDPTTTPSGDPRPTPPEGPTTDPSTTPNRVHP